MMIRIAAAVAAVVVLTGSTAIDGFDFATGADAARYHQLIAEFRCPKCLNTNLAGSDAPIATDLRRTVRRLVLEGMADQQIRDYLQARYGDFVLYDPPLKPATWALWFTPILLVLAAFLVLRRVGVRRAAVVLTEEDKRRLVEL
ncbi:MAG: cytochrome c-type biogenesis protein CcmH, partial [Gammaproteobacteria bacterium]|nr:cytochrome c-type biogenesis protein CcmH [Gammaproteobacteria bacterium]